ERTMAYGAALTKIPFGRQLDLALYGVQVTSLAIHEALLAWIVFAGFRLRKAMADANRPTSPSLNQPSLQANVLLALVGIATGYLWTLILFARGGQLGLRGRLHPTEFGGRWGENDGHLVGWIAALSAGAIIICSLLFKSRWWGLATGLLMGLALSFFVLKH
ncbi:MAG TPA: hypothetical protein VF278_12115, partial [Pirellulales bacterium]